MSFSVEVRDYGLQDFFKYFEAFGREKIQLEVGVLDQGAGLDQKKSGVTNAELAAYHEFGFNNGKVKVEERPFMRGAVARWAGKYRNIVEHRFRVMFASKPSLSGWRDMTLKLLEAIGATAVEDMRKGVVLGQADPPLKENTDEVKARKTRLGQLVNGIVRPLVATGDMIEALSYRIVTRFGEKGRGAKTISMEL